MEYTRHENTSGDIWRKKGNQPEEIGDAEEDSGRGKPEQSLTLPSHSLKIYCPMPSNDIMKFTGKWMELENIILSEVTQTQKDKHAMYPLYSDDTVHISCFYKTERKSELSSCSGCVSSAFDSKQSTRQSHFSKLFHCKVGLYVHLPDLSDYMDHTALLAICQSNNIQVSLKAYNLDSYDETETEEVTQLFQKRQHLCTLAHSSVIITTFFWFNLHAQHQCVRSVRVDTTFCPLEGSAGWCRDLDKGLRS
ncbi:hypothetical protein STEG23_035935 [Scotinomys teguina]